MRILICDDEPVTVRMISGIISDAHPDFEIIGVHSSAELSARLDSEDSRSNPIDVAFLDLALKGESGVSIAEFVSQLHPEVKIIFVTGNQNLASHAMLKVNSFGYIDKPVRAPLVLGYIDKIIKELRRESAADSFCYSEMGQCFRVDSKSIIYIESARNKLKLHLTDGTVKEITGTLDNAEKQLAQSFVRCHKSYLARIGYIARYDSSCFFMINGDSIPIGRSRRDEAVKKYLLFKGVSC